MTRAAVLSYRGNHASRCAKQNSSGCSPPRPHSHRGVMLAGLSRPSGKAALARQPGDCFSNKSYFIVVGLQRCVHSCCIAVSQLYMYMHFSLHSFPLCFIIGD